MSIEVLDVIIRTGYVTIIVPALLLLYRYKASSPALRMYMYGLFIQLISALSTEVLWRNHFNPNYGTSLFYTFAIIFYGKFLVRAIDKKRLIRPFNVVALIHITLCLINLFFVQKDSINTYSGISFSLIVISLCLLYFYTILRDLPSENLLFSPLFWIITAEFLVNTGQMLMKSFAHFLINIFNDNLIVLWVFHHGLNVICNMLILYGAWLNFKMTSAPVKK